MTIFQMENKGVEWCAWSDMDVATSWHGQFNMLGTVFFGVEFSSTVNIETDIINETLGENGDGDLLVLMSNEEEAFMSYFNDMLEEASCF